MAIKVSTVNVNGIRAAVKRRSEYNLGFNQWLEESTADVVCLQEVRATPEQAQEALAPALNAGWFLYAQESTLKGRAGVAILSRYEPLDVRRGFGDNEFAHSGRYIEIDLPVTRAFGEESDTADSSTAESDSAESDSAESDSAELRISPSENNLGADGTIAIGSLYLPSGETQTPKQEEKERFLDSFGEYLRSRANKVAEGEEPETLVCGDWNIAHQERDLKNFKGNLKSSGFLPNEREWMSSLLGREGHGIDSEGRPTGWVDVVRVLHPEQTGPYSWWSYRGKAFDNDAGWRIDYQVATPLLASCVRDAYVERADAYDQRWSDHAPVTAIYR